MHTLILLVFCSPVGILNNNNDIDNDNDNDNN